MFVYYTTTNRVFSEGAFPFSLKKNKSGGEKCGQKQQNAPVHETRGAFCPCEMELKKFANCNNKLDTPW